MKKSGILNSGINQIITSIKHGQKLMVTDAGFPIPQGAYVVDLALVADVPSIIQVLKPLFEEMIYEDVVVATEQKENNPRHYEKLVKLIRRCQVRTVAHEVILKEMTTGVDYYIRTGAFQPWGNVIITSGIDAASWFAKEDVIVPESYRDRVAYSE